MWNCSQCSEQIEDQFEVCWKCGTSKTGIADPGFARRTKADAEQQPSGRGRHLFGTAPERATVAGIGIRCEICRHERFFQREAQLHTAVATFFDLGWLNPTATCLVCARCGYIHWFLPP